VLSAIALRNAERDVEPILSGTMAYLLDGREGQERVKTQTANLGVRDVLPTGAEVSVTGNIQKRYGTGGDSDSDAVASWTAAVRQPLLSGAGYDASHEQLTDAERQALYDVRDFELSRQDLVLRVQSDFYAVVAQKRVVRNRKRSLERFEFLKQRSMRLFEVGRTSEVDMYRANREYLSAENDLIDAEQEYAARLDRLKILVGLETTDEFEVAEEIPESKVEIPNWAGAIRVALHNRLELMTTRNEVEDARRRLRIREQELLPELDAIASMTRSGQDRRVRDVEVDEDRYRLGVELDLPLDRVRERGAVRTARIELRRRRRALALLEDQVMLEVRDSLRGLRSADNSHRIQKEIVKSERKNARIAQMRFENGEIGIQDLTDALSSLADAEDRSVREQVNVETARTQLQRDLGLMRVAEDGKWEE
jgi:outer membrane protein TolC